MEALVKQELQKLLSGKLTCPSDIKGLNKPSSVWMDDATSKAVSGKATFHQKETEKLTSILSRPGKRFQKINSQI